MSMLKAGLAASLSLLVLAGCDLSRTGTATTGRPAQSAKPGEVETQLSSEQLAAVTAVTRAPSPRPAARATPAQLDTTTAEQKAAAAKAPETSEVKLGTTVASLGNPTEGGFWIKTPLVKARGVGRIRNPENGKSAKVDLIPLDAPASGGSQVSLPALQLIGVSLTDLPVIEVFKS
ncbi:hypothetical protein [Paracoccus methylarcula]|uniref:hypothetical protein n=1 Tax=Paracoccus methylarcula TaxID=72022 RepID=UPI001FEA09C1|nr:hypothetical protein [Paracoccus methylarcula]